MHVSHLKEVIEVYTLASLSITYMSYSTVDGHSMSSHLPLVVYSTSWKLPPNPLPSLLPLITPKRSFSNPS